MSNQPLHPDEFLGLGGAYRDIHLERLRAWHRYGTDGKSMEDWGWQDPRWLPALMEEVGEVARAYGEWANGNGDQQDLFRAYQDEVADVGAIAAAWLDSMSRDPR